MPQLSKVTGDGLRRDYYSEKHAKQGLNGGLSRKIREAHRQPNTRHHREPILSASRINLLRPEFSRNMVEPAQLISIAIHLKKSSCLCTRQHLIHNGQVFAAQLRNLFVERQRSL